MSPRRSSLEIAKEHEDRAAKLRAEADRRRSVASDYLCELLYDAEKASRAVAAYSGPGYGLKYLQIAGLFQTDRELRWSKLKAIMEKAKEQG